MFVNFKHLGCSENFAKFIPFIFTLNLIAMSIKCSTCFFFKFNIFSFSVYILVLFMLGSKTFHLTTILENILHTYIYLIILLFHLVRSWMYVVCVFYHLFFNIHALQFDVIMLKLCKFIRIHLWPRTIFVATNFCHSSI